MNKNRFVVLIGIFLFVFVIPLIINMAFKIPAPVPFMEVDWRASDALVFYGSILSACATIYVLNRTIRFTIDNQREERKLSVKPYLSLIKRHCVDVFEIPADDNMIVFEIRKGILGYSIGLPENIKMLIKNKNRIKKLYGVISQDIINFNRENEAFFNENYIWCYELSNYGAGNAMGITFYLDGMSVKDTFCVTIDRPQRVLFILHDDLLDPLTNKCKMEFCFEYKDVASLGTYRQKEEFTFWRNKEGELETFQIGKGMFTEPIEL